MSTSIPKMSKTRVDSFWKRVQVMGDDQCWPWLGRIDDKGYGSVTINGRNVRHHRLAYYLHYGVQPGELYVSHTCCNSDCCNPHHLELTGSRHNSKLTESDIVDIRQSNLKRRELASFYGVSPLTITLIKKRVTWKHVF